MRNRLELQLKCERLLYVSKCACADDPSPSEGQAWRTLYKCYLSFLVSLRHHQQVKQPPFLRFRTRALLQLYATQSSRLQTQYHENLVQEALRSHPGRCRNAIRQNIAQQPHHNERLSIKSGVTNELFQVSAKHVFVSTIDSMGASYVRIR